MLIRFRDPFPRASPHPQPERNMESLTRFDYRSQIIDNCEFFVSKYDVVQVIAVKDALGAFKAYAVRSNENSREALLSSDPCDTVMSAIESLHTKSCEAAHNYITTNGFSYPPDLKKTKLDSSDDDDDDKDEEEDEDEDDADVASIVSGHSASSTVALSYWGSSDDEAAAMTPSSSADPHASHEKGHNHGHKHFHNNVDYASKRRPKIPHAPREPPSPRFGPDDSDDDLRPPHNPLPPRVRLVRTSPVTSASAGNGNGSNGSVTCNSPGNSNGISTGTGVGNSNGNGSGSVNTSSTSYRPPPPPPNWASPVIPPPPMRGPPIPSHMSPPQAAPHYYSPAGSHGQPVPAPPLRPPAVALPAHAHAYMPPGLARPASLHYKASAPNLHSGSGLGSQSQSQNVGLPNPNAAVNVGGVVHHPGSRLYDVRLTIRWPGRGEAKILESARPSVRALQEMAVAYARSHASAFDRPNATPDANANRNGGSPSPDMYSGGGGWALRACVRRAFFGPGEAYDMSAYRGDDLSKLFAVLGAAGIPRFEVEVEAVAPGLVQGQR
ncbi:hypothetical protein F4781DRAFT_349777 [Annulohypoxylon bovei var. microspora]|nr:hypothetical protein F4781DRAFT_349777 [Annulohypoxylon bovei var. microspora]